MTDLKALPTAEERMSDLPAPPIQAIEERRRWDRMMVIFLLIAGVAMATSVIVAALALGGQSEAKGRSNQNAEVATEALKQAGTANGQASAAVAAAEEANRRLRALGKPTVAVPTVSPPSAIPTVEGLNSEQSAAVQSMIAAGLAGYQPALTQAQIQQIAPIAASLVPKPADGKTPTTAELQPLIVAAHAAYCAKGRCDGKVGATGTPGADGSVGPSGPPGPSGAPGDSAPPVTDDQLRPLIVSALAAYCEKQPGETCKGLTGDTGPRGAQGKNFAGMDCLPDGRWRYYVHDPADGSQATFFTDGPCAVAVLPEAARTR